MKSIKDMDFAELTDWAAGYLLTSLIDGNLKSGVHTVLDSSIRWGVARDDERKKELAREEKNRKSRLARAKNTKEKKNDG